MAGIKASFLMTSFSDVLGVNATEFMECESFVYESAGVTPPDGACTTSTPEGEAKCESLVNQIAIIFPF